MITAKRFVCSPKSVMCTEHAISISFAVRNKRHYLLLSYYMNSFKLCNLLVHWRENREIKTDRLNDCVHCISFNRSAFISLHINVCKQLHDAGYRRLVRYKHIQNADAYAAINYNDCILIL